MIELKTNFNYVILWVAAFSFYAFLLTLIREIIKDVEDFEGDNAYGRNTLPIVLGVMNTKLIIITFILFTQFSIIYVYFRFLKDIVTLIYFGLLLIIPLLMLLYKIFVAKEKKDYHFASNLAKGIMLAGILYALVANYLILQHF